jgi:hypothetical protein
MLMPKKVKYRKQQRAGCAEKRIAATLSRLAITA